ncbi:MAG: Wzz/FepE/Etk N-terminal domain-containing protein [Elusimicrobiota bacterium]
MEEQEIDLLDYLRVLKRKWKLVVGVIVAIAVISAVISLLLPKIYQTTAIIEPAKIQKIPVETAATLELLFKNPLNPYLKEIVLAMNIDENKAYKLDKNFKIVDKIGYLSILSNGKSPNEAKKLSDLLCSLILKRHADLMVDVLKISDYEINNIKEQILLVKKDVGQVNKKLLMKESADTQGQGFVFQGLIQSKENALKRQTELEERLRAKNIELKYYTKSAKIVAEASVPRFPIAPQKVTIVLIATLFGFFISIFSAFVIEFFQKNTL